MWNKALVTVLLLQKKPDQVPEQGPLQKQLGGKVRITLYFHFSQCFQSCIHLFHSFHSFFCNSCNEKTVLLISLKPNWTIVCDHNIMCKSYVIIIIIYYYYCFLFLFLRTWDMYQKFLYDCSLLLLLIIIWQYIFCTGIRFLVLIRRSFTYMAAITVFA